MKPAAGLQSVELPVEAGLPAGEPEDVPDWLMGDAAAAPVAAGTFISMDEETDEPMPDWLKSGDEDVATADMPDWLRAGVDNSVASESGEMPNWLEGVDVEEEEIPDWLMDTMQGEDQAAVGASNFQFDSEPAPVKSAPNPPPAPVKKSPAPVPVMAASINVMETLQSARSKISGSDIDGALVEYESIVRANAALDDVVSDLTRLADDKSFKKNATIYRVLGDGLMRRGNLQQALDTYRKALNLL